MAAIPTTLLSLPRTSNGPCAVSAQGNLFTYNVGPIVKFPLSHFEPFVETLFGGAHSNFYRNLLHCLHGIWLSDRQQVPQQ